MSRSLLIQIGILALIVFIGYLTFLYLNKNEFSKSVDSTELKKIQETQINEQIANSQISNQILDIAYKSSDDRGNIYEINSVSGKIEDKNENVLILEDVKAKIIIKNYSTFLIKSGKAKYNKLNLNTHFFSNVNLYYLNHSIKSEDLFLKYIDKEIKISNNVVYKNQNNRLEADEIDLDMITKTSKIYMKDEKNKVKAFIKN
tara:strand:+ start:995 stop:1600 length:606 start_codon:yes stop_codon:yes gene_type:complete